MLSRKRMRESDFKKAIRILTSNAGKAAAKKRRETMTPEQRSARARRMALARWHPAPAAPAIDTVSP